MKQSEYWKDQNTLSVPETILNDPFNSGNITLTGNGYLAYRGTFPDAQRQEYAACTVSDTYDMADGKWKELCTVPNGLFFSLDEHHSYDGVRSTDKEHGIRFTDGITYGSCSFQDKNLGTLTYSFERFASITDIHCIIQKVTLMSTVSGSIEVTTGIDGRIWSLNGNHFRRLRYEAKQDGILCAEGETKEQGFKIVSGTVLKGLGDPEKILEQDGGIFCSHKIKLTAMQPAEVLSIMATYSENDLEDPSAAVVNDLSRLSDLQYSDLSELQQAAWRRFWDTYGVRIEGDPQADALLRYNMYHNRIATPVHSDHLPIGARGLSCQAYQGAAFWDQEIFNMPMYTHVEPQLAKNLLTYRYKTLSGARKKAEDLGYAGAFYPWISGDSGYELCPDYFFKDVLTGRKIRNHFNDWQIHISPDIGYAILNYYDSTRDEAFMLEKGLQMLLEISLFIYSRAVYNMYRGYYEILCVLGPDEYHEKADNNTFTNYQCRYILSRTIELIGNVQENHTDRYERLMESAGVDPDLIAAFNDVADRLFVHEPNPDTGLIEQFDGYFALEDVSPACLAERLIDDQEYWGWPNGIAYETQVTKQADVVQLFMLHPHPVETMRTNYLYYEKRTQHRSSLSPGVHAIVAANCGLIDQAYEYFLKSCSVDIANSHPPTSGGTFIGGIHTAACGIAWQILTKGFCGFEVTDQGISFTPHLPKTWREVSFNLTIYGSSLNVKIDEDSICLEVLDYAGIPIKVSAGSSQALLSGPQKHTFDT